METNTQYFNRSDLETAYAFSIARISYAPFHLNGPHVKIFHDRESLEEFYKKYELYKDNIPVLCKEVLAVDKDSIPQNNQLIACDVMVIPGPKYRYE